MREGSGVEQIKNNYMLFYNNYLLLLTLGVIWLLSAIVSSFNIHISILILLSGITLFRPILFLLGKLLCIPKVYKGEASKLFNKFMILGISFGLVAGFFPFSTSINLFFPTFSIIFGILFGCLAFYFSIGTYSILSFILITIGLYTGYFYPDDFSPAAYTTSFSMISFGLINGLIGEKIKVSYIFNRKKLKRVIRIQSKIA
jgi:hypothetical protein